MLRNLRLQVHISVVTRYIAIFASLLSSYSQIPGWWTSHELYHTHWHIILNLLFDNIPIICRYVVVSFVDIVFEHKQTK